MLLTLLPEIHADVGSNKGVPARVVLLEFLIYARGTANKKPLAYLEGKKEEATDNEDDQGKKDGSQDGCHLFMQRLLRQGRNPR
jgi:hypothetical protein